MIQNFQMTIDKIYDHLYANSSSKTPSAIGEEVGKILHVGMFIEEHCSTKPAFDFNRINSAALLNGEENDRSQYAKKIEDTFTQMNNLWEIYTKDDKINIGSYDLCYCCVQLSGIELSDKSRDFFGDAVEVFRGQWAKRIGGQFFTDQQVTKLAVNLIEFDPRKGDDLIDICAGTGGFLLAGLNRIQHLLKGKKNIDEKDIVKLACKSLKGIEFDKEVCSVANSTLKTRLGIGCKQIVKSGDSFELDKIEDPNFLQENSHRCAATNPPFGTKITIKDPQILKKYELAIRDRGGKKVLNPTAPDILFLEQNVKMLIPGEGRLAIVLPYQILSGPQTFFVRKWLLAHTKIIAVVDLPIETFQPHTGTKTTLLVIQRRQKPDIGLIDKTDYSIFMSIPRYIGHDRRGNPILTKDGTELLTDFNEVTTAFVKYQAGLGGELQDTCFIENYSSILNDPLLRINSKFWKPHNITQENQSTMLKKTDWKNVKLKDLVKDIFYPGRFKRNYVSYSPSAVPFLGGADINEFITHSTKWLSPDDPKLESLKVCKGWILITRSGTTGVVSSVPEAWDGYAMSEHVIRIVPNRDKIEPEYILAVLQSDYIQQILTRGIYGSVIDEINPDYIGNIDIPIPTSKTQYQQIIDMLKEAEKHRHLGIINYMDAIEKMNNLFST